jgi:hypothetical protein
LARMATVSPHNCSYGALCSNRTIATISELQDVTYDKTNERATIKLTKTIPTGEAVIALKYTGCMNSAMRGFYRARYKPTITPASGVPSDGEYHYMFSTQFEACDARTAFPCFDEPNLKASFEFEVEIPEDLVALSNMPEKNSVKSSKDGFKVVSFEKTPPMSTYVSQALMQHSTKSEVLVRPPYDSREGIIITAGPPLYVRSHCDFQSLRFPVTAIFSYCGGPGIIATPFPKSEGETPMISDFILYCDYLI